MGDDVRRSDLETMASQQELTLLEHPSSADRYQLVDGSGERLTHDVGLSLNEIEAWLTDEPDARRLFGRHASLDEIEAWLTGEPDARRLFGPHGLLETAMASSGLKPSDTEIPPERTLQLGYAEPSPEVADWSTRNRGFGAAAGELIGAGETGGEPYGGLRKITDREALARLRAVRLNVAEASETVLLPTSDVKYRYLKTELGLNMIVPTGRSRNFVST